MKRTVIAALFALTAAACATSTAVPKKATGNDIASARTAIKNALRNPASGQFKNFRSFDLSNGERAVCADVNAENGFGGMTGFKPAAVFFGKVKGGLVYLDDTGAFACSQLAAGVSSRT